MSVNPEQGHLVKIPKSFRLVNKQYKVRQLTGKQLQAWMDKFLGPGRMPPGDGAPKGLCDEERGILFLNLDEHVSQADLEHTFLHELVHALLFADGLREHDEATVDRLAGFIHQILLTAK